MLSDFIIKTCYLKVLIKTLCTHFYNQISIKNSYNNQLRQKLLQVFFYTLFKTRVNSQKSDFTFKCTLKIHDMQIMISNRLKIISRIYMIYVGHSNF